MLDLKGDEVEMPKMRVSTFSLWETFDIGQDTGTPATNRYDNHFEFQGDLDKMVVRLTE